jgi:AAA+ ATPase superfamily predicted ATPase
MFDRQAEWEALTAFASDETPGATLGVVSGRRRQGKSYLLESLCEAGSGFYYEATEATAEESLRSLADELAAYGGSTVPPRLTTWEQALDALLALGTERAVPVVLDEFPYLCKAVPALPSIVQKTLGPRRPQRTGSRTRLLLCGSAISFMAKLLSGAAPLRGRAGLDLNVPTFDYRLAADFWGIDDWRLAVPLHAIVGGTPAYRREYVRGDAPSSVNDFDSWVTRTVLDPRTPLFREGRYLLAEEPDLRDRALYHSILAAVAAGNQTRGGIASYTGRPADVLGHPLMVLEDSGFLIRDDDPFHSGRSRYRIAEPIITFYHAIMRPVWRRLERPGRATQVWHDSRERFKAAVLGPHFEAISRTWVSDFAASGTIGDLPARVIDGVVNDPGARTTHQVDIVALGPGEGRRKKVLALGEVKWGVRLDLPALQRLQHIRSLLTARPDIDVSEARLLCVSGRGFSADLVDAQRRGEVILVDLERLYAGD